MQNIFSSGGNGAAVGPGQDIFADLNLDSFALVYEMNGSDLEIKLFLGEEIESPFFFPIDFAFDHSGIFTQLKSQIFKLH